MVRNAHLRVFVDDVSTHTTRPEIQRFPLLADGRPGFVYVLRLKGGQCDHDRYYVGSTKDPQKRIADHLSGKGAKVTKRHPADAIELESIKQTSSGASARKEETAAYLELRNKHGKDKVRGAVCMQKPLVIVADA